MKKVGSSEAQSIDLRPEDTVPKSSAASAGTVPEPP